MYDSVFSRFSIDPNKETTIIPEKRIKRELESLEKSAIALFTNTYDKYISNAVTQVSKEDDIGKAIADHKWGLNNELAKNLWGEWLLGLGKGDIHARDEIEPKKFTAANNIVEFRQPDAEVATIRNVPAEQAIKERANKLSKDVSDSEWKQIKSALLDSVKPVSADANPISRNELLKKINNILGEKKNRFKRRAEAIARTELTFAYNVGRLNSYIDSGLVKAVKFISILDGRRCAQCESRQGLIVNLNDPENLAKIMPPIHPMCRCVISPVMDTEFKKESDRPQRQVKNRSLVTEASPWMMAGILAAVIAKAYVTRKTTSAINVAKGVQKAVDIGIASSVQSATTPTRKDTSKTTDKVSSKVVTKLPKRQAVTTTSSTTNYLPIKLSGNVDLRTATFVQLRSLFDKSQLSDKNIFDIIDYRDRNGLTSVDDLRNVLGIGSVKLQSLKQVVNNNQLLSFLDPQVNQSAMTLWAKSGGTLNKSQARSLHKAIQKESYSTIEELEARLKAQGLNDKIINDLKQRAVAQHQAQIKKVKELQEIKQQQKGGDIVPVKMGKGGAILPVNRARPVSKTQLGKPSRGAVLNSVDSSLADIEGQIGTLRSRYVSDIRTQQQKLGLQETINASNSGVESAKIVSRQIIDDLLPYGTTVTKLNNRIKELEGKLAGLLDPSVDDYFLLLKPEVAAIKNEIQSIRGELNKAVKHANKETRLASDRSKQLTKGQRQVSKALPKYDELDTIRSQLQRIARQLDEEAIKGKPNSVAISALRAKYRALQAQLDDVNNLRSKPFKQYSGDKTAISGYMGEVKKSTRNLSSRLTNLENKLDILPKKVSELAPSVRKKYRALPSAMVKSGNYKPPVRIAPGVQGSQARAVKAARVSRQRDISDRASASIAKTNDLVASADEKWLTKKNTSQVKNYQQKAKELKTTSSKAIEDTAIAAKKSSTKVTELEDKVASIYRKIEDDIYDPLGDNWFKDNGVISQSGLGRIRSIEKEIKNLINEVDSRISALKKASKQAASLKKNISKLREKANSIQLNISDCAQLNRQLEAYLVDLDKLTKFEVNAKFFNSEVPKIRDRITAILNGTSTSLNSSIKQNLDELIDEVGKIENALSVSSNAGSITTLVQAKQRMQSSLTKIKSFPRRISDLPESVKIEWESTRGIREAATKAKNNLDDAVTEYRSLANTQKNKANQIGRQIDDSTADILDSDIYSKNLDDAILKQRDSVKVGISELDENLKLLKLATNTEQGLELVYSDLKQIYTSNIPGLATVTENKFPVGLDEAMDVKRRITQFLIDRGEQIANKTQNAMAYDKARSTTRYKLSVIEDQIKEVENLQSAIASQKNVVKKIDKASRDLLYADPLLYQDIKKSPLFGEIQDNAVILLQKTNKQLDKLKEARSQLRRDLKKKIVYEARDIDVIDLVDGVPTKGKKASFRGKDTDVMEQLNAYRQTVTEITNTSRRSQLLQIGKQLRERPGKTVKLYGKNSLSDNLKTGKPLTKGQQAAFDSLEPKQQEIFREASTIGIIDLYDDLFKLDSLHADLALDEVAEVKNLFSVLGIASKKRIKAKSLKTKIFEDVTTKLGELQGLGYQGLAIEIGEDSASYIGVPKRFKSLVVDSSKSSKLAKVLGVNAKTGKPIPTSNTKIMAIANGTLTDYKDVTYNEVLQAIALNRELRNQIHNRLDAFNFDAWVENFVAFG